MSSSSPLVGNSMDCRIEEEQGSHLVKLSVAVENETFLPLVVSHLMV